MKFAVSIFTSVVIIIIAVLFVQYQVYSDQIENSEAPFNYSQEIEVVYREGSLDIRHHFKNLPQHEVELVLPNGVTSVECFLEAEYSCNRLDGISKNSILPGETRSQSISYVIPIEGGLTTSKVLKNVFVQLQLGEAKFSIIHISTDSMTKGQWVTGLPLIGAQQLSLVNYTMFSGEGPVKDLYWDSRTMAPQSIQSALSLYSEQPISIELKDQLATLSFLDDTHISIVQGDPISNGYRMLFMPEITVQSVQHSLLISQLNAMYTFEEPFPLWLKEVMIAFMTETQPTNTKAQEIVAQLQSMMSSDQLQQWKDILRQLTNEKVSTQLLDEKIAEVLKSPTNYFLKNSEVDYVYPFYFIDNREVLYNQKPQSIDIIYYEGKILYEAQPFLEALGYDAYEGENGYYVNNETRIFRFPEEHGFYVFNQRRYNTASMPIIKIEDEYFIEETWMQRLFLVELSKTDNAINITSVNAQTKIES